LEYERPVQVVDKGGDEGWQYTADKGWQWTGVGRRQGLAVDKDRQ